MSAKMTTQTELQRSQRLATALKSVGIDVEEKYLVQNLPLTTNRQNNQSMSELYQEGTKEILLTENLLVLQTVGQRLELTVTHSARERQCWGGKKRILIFFPDKPLTEDVVRYYKQNEWEAAMCAALVEAIQKTLGVGEG